MDWISVEERLPEKGEFVLVLGFRGGIRVAAHWPESEPWWGDQHGNRIFASHYAAPVTHWMPLPDAPKPPKPKLRACPFCGGRGEITHQAFSDGYTAVVVRCSSCGIEGPHTDSGDLEVDMASATEGWNKRSLVAALDAGFGDASALEQARSNHVARNQT